MNRALLHVQDGSCNLVKPISKRELRLYPVSRQCREFLAVHEEVEGAASVTSGFSSSSTAQQAQGVQREVVLEILSNFEQDVDPCDAVEYNFDEDYRRCHDVQHPHGTSITAIQHQQESVPAFARNRINFRMEISSTRSGSAAGGSRWPQHPDDVATCPSSSPVHDVTNGSAVGASTSGSLQGRPSAQFYTSRSSTCSASASQKFSSTCSQGRTSAPSTSKKQYGQHSGEQLLRSALVAATKRACFGADHIQEEIEKMEEDDDNLIFLHEKNHKLREKENTTSIIKKPEDAAPLGEDNDELSEISPMHLQDHDRGPPPSSSRKTVDNKNFFDGTTSGHATSVDLHTSIRESVASTIVEPRLLEEELLSLRKDKERLSQQQTAASSLNPTRMSSGSSSSSTTPHRHKMMNVRPQEFKVKLSTTPPSDWLACVVHRVCLNDRNLKKLDLSNIRFPEEEKLFLDKLFCSLAKANTELESLSLKNCDLGTSLLAAVEVATSATEDFEGTTTADGTTTTCNNNTIAGERTLDAAGSPTTNPSAPPPGCRATSPAGARPSTPAQEPTPLTTHYFFQFLEENTTLKTLNLENNNLNADQVARIAEALMENENTNLETLHLSGNEHSTNGVSAGGNSRVTARFAELMDQNSSLKKLGLDLKNNADHRHRIDRALMRNARASFQDVVDHYG
ncbi:unnamed protein product [Amoebophrya sp. A120]|nr:unnamed protein product [Amoebophrya sp. A120]|eukprot:GSA120T00009079001.1